jgi:biopolymer transport protein ExbD
MSPQQPSKRRNRSLPIFDIALLVLFFVVCTVGFVSSRAQEPQSNSAAASTQQRELEDRIPKHLPIKVKVNNLNNEKWEHDLEVEVKNESDKPIYYLDMFLSMNEVKSPAGHEIGFTLRYGRIELIEFDAPLEPTDVPIQPGATYVFKLAEKNVKGWESYKKKVNIEPRKFQLIFAYLSFGDGTGFIGTGGEPADIHKKPSSASNCSSGNKRSDELTHTFASTNQSPSYRQPFCR